jgi:hypothetical protein
VNLHRGSYSCEAAKQPTFRVTEGQSASVRISRSLETHKFNRKPEAEQGRGMTLKIASARKYLGRLRHRDEVSF